MKVSTRSWHGRVYRYWCNSPHTGRRWRLDLSGRAPDTLCHYTRVVLLYAPLLWLGTARTSGPAWLRPWHPLAAAVVITAPALGLAVAPHRTLGVLAAFGVGVVAIVAFLGLMYGAFALREWLDDRRMAREPKEYRGPGFGTVAWGFVKAKKRKVCPFIEVVDDAGASI